MATYNQPPSWSCRRLGGGPFGSYVRPIEHDLPNVGFTNILPIFLVKPDESERGLLHHKTVVNRPKLYFVTDVVVVDRDSGGGHNAGDRDSGGGHNAAAATG